MKLFVIVYISLFYSIWAQAATSLQSSQDPTRSFIEQPDEHLHTTDTWSFKRWLRQYNSFIEEVRSLSISDIPNVLQLESKSERFNFLTTKLQYFLKSQGLQLTSTHAHLVEAGTAIPVWVITVDGKAQTLLQKLIENLTNEQTLFILSPYIEFLASRKSNDLSHGQILTAYSHSHSAQTNSKAAKKQKIEKINLESLQLENSVIKAGSTLINFSVATFNKMLTNTRSIEFTDLIYLSEITKQLTLQPVANSLNHSHLYSIQYRNLNENSQSELFSPAHRLGNILALQSKLSAINILMENPDKTEDINNLQTERLETEKSIQVLRTHILKQALQPIEKWLNFQSKVDMAIRHNRTALNSELILRLGKNQDQTEVILPIFNKTPQELQLNKAELLRTVSNIVSEAHSLLAKLAEDIPPSPIDLASLEIFKSAWSTAEQTADDSMTEEPQPETSSLKRLMESESTGWKRRFEFIQHDYERYLKLKLNEQQEFPAHQNESVKTTTDLLSQLLNQPKNLSQLSILANELHSDLERIGLSAQIEVYTLPELNNLTVPLIEIRANATQLREQDIENQQRLNLILNQVNTFQGTLVLSPFLELVMQKNKVLGDSIDGHVFRIIKSNKTEENNSKQDFNFGLWLPLHIFSNLDLEMLSVQSSILFREFIQVRNYHTLLYGSLSADHISLRLKELSWTPTPLMNLFNQKNLLDVLLQTFRSLHNKENNWSDQVYDLMTYKESVSNQIQILKKSIVQWLPLIEEWAISRTPSQELRVTLQVEPISQWGQAVFYLPNQTLTIPFSGYRLETLENDPELFDSLLKNQLNSIKSVYYCPDIL